MDELKQTAIERYYANIIKSMDPLLVVDNFRAGFISTAEKESINEAHSTRREKNRELIFILFRKREDLKPFERFIQALKKTDANHIIMAKDLLKTYAHNNCAMSQKISPTSLSDTEETKYSLQTAQQALKTKYLKIFKTVYPFSLPFTFDIENTWVSLALKGGWENSPATEDHGKLIKRALEKDFDNPKSENKILIIEGNPATGKTSLMRKLAYEWAKGEQGLLHYHLVVYGEFREVREQTFKGIADLVLECSKKYFSDRKNSLDNQSFKKLKKLMNSEQFCEKHKILVLLDGYDESSLEKQCKKLNTYLSAKTIDDTLLFNIVITTRKGYLSHLQGRRGRFVFAEVLGFTTEQQKEKYIFNHFLSSETDNKEKIAAVHSLLDNNENLNKLAETPLFLTFICLVYERIFDGTLVELYRNIIWWLIDRHQQDFPDRDIPALFGFQNGFSNKFETIQEHYLHFPQLHYLGNMALRNLQKDIFECSDYVKYKLQLIIEKVGLLRKEKKHDNSFKLATSYFFPHRTIQEFLAAFYCLCSDDPTTEWLLPNSALHSTIMNEFEKFLLRIALSDNMPINTEKRKYYFERIAETELDMKFDAFNTTTGFNNDRLNWFFSQCANMLTFVFFNKQNSTEDELNMFNNPFIHNELDIIPNMFSPTLLLFSGLLQLYSVTFFECTFQANSQLFITNCPSLKNLEFSTCSIESNTTIDIAIWSTIDTVKFEACTFEANSQLSFTNCPFVKNLIFNGCEIKGNANLGIATLSESDAVEFNESNIDLITWQSITNQISNSSVKYLQLTFRYLFNKEFLIHLQNCNNIEKLEITLRDYKIFQNDLLSFSDLLKLRSLLLWKCTFEGDSQLFFTNCPYLKNLQFISCRMKSSRIVGIATLPAIDTVEFNASNIDLITWQSITNQIQNSSVKYLKFSAEYFGGKISPPFLKYLQNCEHIEEIQVIHYSDSNGSILNFCEEEETANLAQMAQKMPGLRSIILDLRGKRLIEWNKAQIERIGRERNPYFLIKYVE